MLAVELNDTLKYLIDAVSTSHWAEVLLLVVLTALFVGGGYLMYKKMESNERILMRLLDMLGFREKAPPPEDKDGDKPG